MNELDELSMMLIPRDYVKATHNNTNTTEALLKRIMERKNA
jgi:hypothetical protein